MVVMVFDYCGGGGFCGEGNKGKVREKRDGGR